MNGISRVTTMLAILIAYLIIPLALGFFYRRELVHWIARPPEDVKYLGWLVLLYFWLSTLHFLNSEFTLTHDNRFYHYPVFAYTLAALKHSGELPLWNPFVGDGLPSIVMAQNWFTLLPTRIPFYLLAAYSPWVPDSLLLYKLNLILNGLVILIFSYALLKELFRDPKVVAWGLTLVGLSGMTGSLLFQEQLAASLLYIPLIGWLLLRWFRTESRFAALAVGLALGHSFAHHYPHLEIYLGAIALIAIFFTQKAFRERLWARRIPFVRAFVFFFLPALLLGAALVGYNFFSYFDRLVSPARMDQLGVGYDQIELLKTNSLDPRTLLTYLFPWKSILMELTSDNIPVDRTPYYLGWLGLGFALWGMVTTHRKGLRDTCLVMFVLIFLFALGRRAFVYDLLFRFLPYASLQRIPLHMGNYLNLTLILLSCLGLEALVLRLGGLSAHRAKMVLGILFLLQLTDLGLFSRGILSRAADRYPVATKMRELSLPSSLDAGDPYRQASQLSSKLLSFKDASEIGRQIGVRMGFLGFTGAKGSAVWEDERVFASDLKIDRSHASVDRVDLDLWTSRSLMFFWRMNADVGWKATVDGIPTKLASLGPALVGLPLEKGHQTLTLAYEAPVHRLLFTWHLLLGLVLVGILPLACRRNVAPPTRPLA